MGVTLYTSRVILNALGVSDYGIYNVVGGIVAMFGFINGAMASSTQRYLSFDIGKGDFAALKKTFSASLTVHLVIAIGVVLIGESLGLWYVNYKMVFPPERLLAVNVVYQFSLLTLFLDIVQVPYNALILARERMNIYAYISVFEAILKLFVAFSLLYFGFDKLILYSILTFLVAFVIRLSYQIYCRKSFAESRYRFDYDPIYFKELVLYSGWNLIGALSLIGKNQGVNIVLNLFFGTIVNAAYGISMQVQAAVTQFISNFQSALNPQIIQNYAANKKERSLQLIFLGAKFSFFVVQVLAVPILINIDFILKTWLGASLPDYTTQFLKISLIILMIDSISGPISTGLLATGRIKYYQMIIGGLNLTIPVLVYLFYLKYKYPEKGFYVLMVLSVLSLVLRLVFLRRSFRFSNLDLFKRLFAPIFSISVTGYFSTIIIENVIIGTNLFHFLLSTVLFVFIQSFSIFMVGLNNEQRKSILKFLGKRFRGF